MKSRKIHCIYCGVEVDPTIGDGDHVTPAALGEFRNDKHFRGICRDCNSIIGRSEQQLLQCGPERIYREVVKPALPSNRNRTWSNAAGANGVPPPLRTVQGNSGPELVQTDFENPQNAYPLDQLVVLKDGVEKFIRLYPGMRPAQLQKQLERAGVTDLKAARLHCGDDRYEEFKKLVLTVSPSSKIEDAESTEAGVRKLPSRIIAVMNKQYFQAVAKIAFHYYLIHNRRGLRGDEQEFTQIRNFILNGSGEVETFFHSSGVQFPLPFGPTADGRLVAPSFWCHLLAAFEAKGVIVAYVHLFLGPGVHRPGRWVTLGSLNSKIVLPTSGMAHVYKYDSPQPESGKAGEVEELQVFQGS